MIDTYPLAHFFVGGIASRLVDTRTHTTVCDDVDTHIVFFCSDPHRGPAMPDRFPFVFPTHTTMRENVAASTECDVTPISPMSERTRHPTPSPIREVGRGPACTL